MQSQFGGALTDMKRELANGQLLSESQLLFVTAILQGNSKAEAARQAGYRSEQAGMAAWRSKKVQAAIATVIDRFLVGEASVMALRTLYLIANSDKTAEGVRVAAANSILDRAGFTAKRHENKALGDQDVSAMSRDQLRDAIDKLDRELSSRMVDVTPDPGDGAPIDEPMTGQEIDTYE